MGHREREQLKYLLVSSDLHGMSLTPPPLVMPRCQDLISILASNVHAVPIRSDGVCILVRLLLYWKGIMRKAEIPGILIPP
jgi:hypothetical protein